MSFRDHNSPKVALRGASQIAETSADIREHAKHERERRRVAKEQPKAAITIARYWRGFHARSAASKALRSEWMQRYGILSSRPDAYIAPNELSEKLLPLVLAIYVGPRHNALAAGAPLCLSAVWEDTACLRGSLYLILRNLKASSPSSKDSGSILGLFKQEGRSLEQNDDDDDVSFPPPDVCLVSRLKRTITLCIATIGNSQVDALTQAAAARILFLLTTTTTWPVGTEMRREEVSVWMSEALAALPIAAQRVLLQLHASVENSDGGINSSAINARNQREAAAGNVVATLTHLLGATANLESRGCVADSLVVHVLSVPGALQYINAATRATLSGHENFLLLADKAGGAAAASVGIFSLAERLRLLTNFTQLYVTLINNESTNTTSKLAIERFAQAADALLLLTPTQSLPRPPTIDADTSAAIDAATEIFGNGSTASILLKSTDLATFCRIYSSLLVITNEIASSQQQSTSMHLLGALAFATPLLPRLWQCLATNIGLPREVPSQATRFDIPSLPRGLASMPATETQLFSLFCRVHALYLAVALDVELHEEQTLFSVAEQRGIAVSLNTIVFRTHLPSLVEKNTHRTVATSTPTPSLSSSVALLDEALVYAARLLRALHERDTRRAFCNPSMWLACYTSATRTAKSAAVVDLSGRAVLQALLQAQADEDSGDSCDYTSDCSDDEETFNAQAASKVRRQTLRQQQRRRPWGLAGLLLDAPHCIPFNARVEVLRGLIAADKKARKLDLAPIDGGPHPYRITIRRSHLLEDALAALLPSGYIPVAALRSRLTVSFFDVHGNLEAGVDMGGLTKELLECVCSSVFDPNRGIFTTTPQQQELFPHPTAHLQPSGTALLTLAGAMLGRALFDGILLQAPLAPFFVSRLQGRLPTLDDLAALDQDVWRSLVMIKRFNQEDVSALALDFTVETDTFGHMQVHELIHNGSNTAVTSENKLQYCNLVADWHLRRRLGPGAAAFGRGLAAVLPPAWLRLFTAREVNLLLGGGEGGEIDIEDMRAHTQYAGGYSSLSTTVKNFWKVVKGLNKEDKAALLRFTTGVARPPLGGFAYMNPPLTIYKVSCSAGPLAMLGGKDVDRLPSASTCANTLKLPNYRRESTLKEKLLCAVRSGAGFDLS